MNKLVLFLGLLPVSCASLPPSTPVTIYPTLLPMPTLAVNTKPIGEADIEAAHNFFYHLKIHVVSRDYEHMAEKIRYPITVNVEGQEKTFIYVAELTAYFTRIFSDEKIQQFVSIDESELTFTPDGVKVADGIIWFDLICMDTACDTAAFLITDIN